MDKRGKTHHTRGKDHPHTWLKGRWVRRGAIPSRGLLDGRQRSPRWWRESCCRKSRDDNSWDIDDFSVTMDLIDWLIDDLSVTMESLGRSPKVASMLTTQKESWLLQKITQRRWLVYWRLRSVTIWLICVWCMVGICYYMVGICLVYGWYMLLYGYDIDDWRVLL